MPANPVLTGGLAADVERRADLAPADTEPGQPVDLVDDRGLYLALALDQLTEQLRAPVVAQRV
jgi:hypothetical protein